MKSLFAIITALLVSSALHASGSYQIVELTARDQIRATHKLTPVNDQLEFYDIKKRTGVTTSLEIKAGDQSYTSNSFFASLEVGACEAESFLQAVRVVGQGEVTQGYFFEDHSYSMPGKLHDHAHPHHGYSHWHYDYDPYHEHYHSHYIHDHYHHHRHWIGHCHAGRATPHGGSTRCYLPVLKLMVGDKNQLDSWSLTGREVTCKK